MRDELHRHNQAVKIVSHMIEIEVRARGLREMGRILELNRRLVEIAGLGYKVDTNHDIVCLEFDEPSLSVREIWAIFPNLALQPLFISAIPTELHSRTKTKRLSVGNAIDDQ